jgi:Dolichyl-phosphate-mannose-protein mannosyltransferase
MTTAASFEAETAPRPAWTRGLEPYFAAIVFCVGLGARLWLIHSFPVIFGGDSIVRLANREHILLSYQLPLLQAAVHYLSVLTSDPLAVRYFMAFAGAAAGLAFYAMARPLLGGTPAFETSLLFATSPFVLAFSIVPYQEILMLAGLFAAFYFAFEHRWELAGVSVGLACLTRYEAWLACPVLAVVFLIERGLRPAEVAKAALLFGWAPLGWILFQGGVTPAGTFAAEASFSLERLFRYVYLGWITVKNTPIPVLLLALWGLWLFLRRGLLRERPYRMLVCFLTLFLAAVLLSAHGERDQPERFVTAREAHVLLAATVLLAGIGLQAVRRFRGTLVAVSCCAGLWMAHGFVARETSEPPFALSYEAARYLDAHVGAGEQVVVLAQGVPADLLARYLDKAERGGGHAARDKALGVLVDLDNSPPNYQRILVHSRLGKEQLRSVASLPGGLVPHQDPTVRGGNTAVMGLAGHAPVLTPAWIVLWSDFSPTNEVEKRLREKVTGIEPERVFERVGLRVAIYRLG